MRGWTRTSWTAALLLIVAGFAAYRADEMADRIYDYPSSYSTGHGIGALAFSLVFAACLCTAAVLWCRERRTGA